MEQRVYFGKMITTRGNNTAFQLKLHIIINLVKYIIDVVNVVNSISHALEQWLIFHQGHLVTLTSSNVEVELRQNFYCPLNSM